MKSLKSKIEYKMTNFNRVKIIKQDNLKNRVETRIQTRIEKIKKIFLDSSPHRKPAENGEGASSQKVGGIYSEGKCADFALCVRTQIDFYLECGITAHSDNKTRLNRFICIHNGRYARKRNRNMVKSVYLCTILLQTCIFIR